MKKTPFKRVAFYYRPDMIHVLPWKEKIERWIKKQYPRTHILESIGTPKQKKHAPDLLIVLGGDGTIIEAAQRFQRWNPLIFGLNLGHVGFLASVREKTRFLSGIARVFRHEFRTLPRMLMQTSLIRKGKKIYSGFALNDIAVQNLLGIVDIGVFVEGRIIQHIHGTGVIVSTATGSTAYNLSAHGPIVMPDVKCFILTEILDHSIPTPSLIIKRNRTITLTIDDFRERDRFIIKHTGETADVVLASDIDRIIALKKGDKVVVRKSERLVRFIEFEKDYFFKSLQEKFSFR
ncbi:MAG: hypothetical protein A3H69_03745 [Candidatus Sungbacteria bacterium RIFCSPLOWO2_02_FULL_47_9]|uniref:NAD kinase n=1 Tax=Candidatus Sungbacteria bacterium RIFCSPHIGHO2_01_FULL_47_32 TaxID=1802264 RepID=A0A1G2K510_9BACT|nr:MAG: hypothetical protein A2633_06185 [Candidatus Sungbacteria bacterium RIFCSPHIGHO2_01_FULL_47_32]OHA09984.1 MAG: hypothetical protein A3H69_03745 [Candidatus Sungbacteria bacterium RIFCSPLOWO2_02_FULL_47_9]